MFIAKASKGSFADIQEFYQSVLRPFKWITVPTPYKPLDAEEFFATIELLVANLQQPPYLERSDFVRAELIRREWNVAEIVAEFSEDYMYWVWSTTG